jgi:tRNA A37 threonylcarbamoyladenosine synthetase subunit TsaC/SUA5/YrdC
MLLAVRIPDDSKLISLLEKTGPLLTSSANKTGRPTLTNIDGATKIFGDTVDFYVDGGDYSNKEASAVIRIIDDAVEVLRPGNRFTK